MEVWGARVFRRLGRAILFDRNTNILPRNSRALLYEGSKLLRMNIYTFGHAQKITNCRGAGCRQERRYIYLYLSRSVGGWPEERGRLLAAAASVPIA